MQLEEIIEITPCWNGRKPRVETFSTPGGSQVLAIRYNNTPEVERCFVENFELFREKNLSTKVVGNSLLVFPKGG